MTARAILIATVLEQIAGIGRELTASRARPFGEHRLSRTQWDALFFLSHARGPVTSGDLAQSLDVTRGAVTQLVAGLREAGLVETLVPDDDARVRVIQLTPAARGQVDAFERAAVERLAPRFAGLGDDDLTALSTLLARRADAS